MDARLHRRMTRAMGDAEEEVELVSGSESGGEWGGIKSADPENFQNRRMEISKGDTRALDSDRVSDEDDVGSDDSTAVQSTAGKYLPDHLFATALAKSRPRDCARPSQTTPKARSNNKKRRHPLARAKDVVVGTRTLHTLSSSTGRSPVPAPGTTVAPPRIKKFLAKILALHGPEKRTSKLSLRWERRPSHLGLSKRTTGAPITAFARAQQRQVGTPSSHEHD